jgi:hypothetical protein
MRTTLDLSDALLRGAKRRAAEEGRTLTSVIEEALREYLAPRRNGAKPFRLRVLTRRGRLLPGVDLSDRSALYDRMERDR